MREDGGYASWRQSIEDALGNLEFYHPEGFKHKHGGFSVTGAVSEDITGIRAADGVIAYITESPQIGTVTELLHAVHNDTPILVLFKEQRQGEGVVSGMITGNEEDYEAQQVRYPAEIKPLSVRDHGGDFWFLINYLVGDRNLKHTDSTMQGDVDGGLPGKITRWKGVRQSTVMVVPDTEENLRLAVNSWVEMEFGTEAASSIISTGDSG